MNGGVIFLKTTQLITHQNVEAIELAKFGTYRRICRKRKVKMALYIVVQMTIYENVDL